MNNWQAEARRLVRERLTAEPGRVAALWAEVEAEAWQEVRAVVKAAMVEALLEELGGGETRRWGDRELKELREPGDAGKREHEDAPGGQSAAVGGQFSAAHSQFQRPPSQLTPTGGQSSIVAQAAHDISANPPFETAHETGKSWNGGFSRSDGVQEQEQPAEASNPEQQEAISSAVSDQPAPNGVYVYGVTDRTELAGLPAEGVAAGKPVTLLPYRDLAAVVSEVPLDEWGQEALEARLADLAWLEARVRTHQAVLDAVLPLATLAPMKFATIYLSQDGVTEFLTAHYDEFVALLGHLRGRQEWGLKLYCDDATLAAHIAEISPEVARLRAEIASKPKGAAYLLARKLQETSDHESERVEMDVADRTHTALTEQSVAAGLNPLQSTEITGRTERMLLNGAYLVDAAALEAFQAALAEIAAEYGSRGFQFELSGPWPAYNFTRLGA
jgi:hypothetical protein